MPLRVGGAQPRAVTRLEALLGIAVAMLGHHQTIICVRLLFALAGSVVIAATVTTMAWLPAEVDTTIAACVALVWTYWLDRLEAR